MALIVSGTNLELALRITVLALSTVYTLLKIWKLVKPKAPINDTDPEVKP